MGKSSRLSPHDKLVRKTEIDARRLRHTVDQKPLAAAAMLLASEGRRALGGGKYIPAGRLRNVPLTNR